MITLVNMQQYLTLLTQKATSQTLNKPNCKKPHNCNSNYAAKNA